MADSDPSGTAPGPEPGPETGSGPTVTPGDLDELIGAARREGARRRAEPDFPVEEEAALCADMDRRGPRGPGVDIRAATDALQELSRSLRADQQGGAADVADLAASALRGVGQRLAELERRLGRAREGPAGDGEP